jgi:HEAT repeat protein
MKTVFLRLISIGVVISFSWTNLIWAGGFTEMVNKSFSDKLAIPPQIEKILGEADINVLALAGIHMFKDGDFNLAGVIGDTEKFIKDISRKAGIAVEDVNKNVILFPLNGNNGGKVLYLFIKGKNNSLVYLRIPTNPDVEDDLQTALGGYQMELSGLEGLRNGLTAYLINSSTYAVVARAISAAFERKLSDIKPAPMPETRKTNPLQEGKGVVEVMIGISIILAITFLTVLSPNLITGLIMAIALGLVVTSVIGLRIKQSRFSPAVRTVAALVVLCLSACATTMKGPTISLGDDPSGYSIRQSAIEKFVLKGKSALPGIDDIWDDIRILGQGAVYSNKNVRDAYNRLVAQGARAVPALMRVLSDGHSHDDKEGGGQFQLNIGDTLGAIGEPAVPPLIERLNKGRFNPTGGVILVFGKIGEPAVADLIKALRSKDEEVRRTAANSLGEIGDPAMAELEKVLNGSDKAARNAALSAIVSKVIGDSNKKRTYAAGDPIGEIFSRMLPKVIEILKESKGRDFYVTHSAIIFLRYKSHISIAVPVLREVLNTGSVEEAISAVRVLEEFGGRALPVLRIAAVKHKKADIRRAAEEALTRMGEPVIRGTVVSLGDYPGGESVRKAVIDRFVVEGKSALPGIDDIWDDIQILGQGAVYSNKDVRAAYDRLVAQGARAVPALMRVLGDGHFADDDKEGGGQFQLNIGDTLSSIGAPAVPPLIARLNEGRFNSSGGISNIFGKIGKPAVADLIKALESKDEEVRQAAANSLGQIGDYAMAELEKVLNGSDKAARNAALSALATKVIVDYNAKRQYEEGDETAKISVRILPKVFQILNENKGQSVPDVTHSAIIVLRYALFNFKTDSAIVIPLLEDLLGFGGYEEGIFAVNGLEEFGEKVLPTLRKVADGHKEDEVRRTAKEALIRIQNKIQGVEKKPRGKIWDGSSSDLRFGFPISHSYTNEETLKPYIVEEKVVAYSEEGKKVENMILKAGESIASSVRVPLIDRDPTADQKIQMAYAIAANWDFEADRATLENLSTNGVDLFEFRKIFTNVRMFIIKGRYFLDDECKLIAHAGGLGLRRAEYGPARIWIGEMAVKTLSPLDIAKIMIQEGLHIYKRAYRHKEYELDTEEGVWHDKDFLFKIYGQLRNALPKEVSGALAEQEETRRVVTKKLLETIYTPNNADSRAVSSFRRLILVIAGLPKLYYDYVMQNLKTRVNITIKEIDARIVGEILIDLIEKFEATQLQDPSSDARSLQGEDSEITQKTLRPGESIERKVFNESVWISVNGRECKIQRTGVFSLLLVWQGKTIKMQEYIHKDKVIGGKTEDCLISVTYAVGEDGVTAIYNDDSEDVKTEKLRGKYFQIDCPRSHVPVADSFNIVNLGKDDVVVKWRAVRPYGKRFTEKPRINIDGSTLIISRTILSHFLEFGFERQEAFEGFLRKEAVKAGDADVPALLARDEFSDDFKRWLAGVFVRRICSIAVDVLRKHEPSCIEDNANFLAEKVQDAKRLKSAFYGAECREHYAKSAINDYWNDPFGWLGNLARVSSVSIYSIAEQELFPEIKYGENWYSDAWTTFTSIEGQFQNDLIPIYLSRPLLGDDAVGNFQRLEYLLIWFARYFYPKDRDPDPIQLEEIEMQVLEFLQAKYNFMQEVIKRALEIRQQKEKELKRLRGEFTEKINRETTEEKPFVGELTIVVPAIEDWRIQQVAFEIWVEGDQVVITRSDTSEQRKINFGSDGMTQRISIGRGVENDYNVPNDFVSGQHCSVTIRRGEGGIYYFSVNDSSKNGTIVAWKEKRETTKQLQDGEIVDVRKKTDESVGKQGPIGKIAKQDSRYVEYGEIEVKDGKLVPEEKLLTSEDIGEAKIALLNAQTENLTSEFGAGILSAIDAIRIVDNIGIDQLQKGSNNIVPFACIEEKDGKRTLLVDKDILNVDAENTGVSKLVLHHELVVETMLTLIPHSSQAERELAANVMSLKYGLKMLREGKLNLDALENILDKLSADEKFFKALNTLQSEVTDEQVTVVAIEHMRAMPHYDGLYRQFSFAAVWGFGVHALVSRTVNRYEAALSLFNQIAEARKLASEAATKEAQADRIRSGLNAITSAGIEINPSIAKPAKKFTMLVSSIVVRQVGLVDTLLNESKFVKLYVEDLEKNPQVVKWLKEILQNKDRSPFYFVSRGTDIGEFLNRNEFKQADINGINPKSIIDVPDLQFAIENNLSNKENIFLPILYSISGIYIAAQVALAGAEGMEVLQKKDPLAYNSLMSMYQAVYGDSFKIADLIAVLKGVLPKIEPVLANLNALRTAIQKIEIAA